MTVKVIGVIGAGQMGHGIALVSAQAGFDVVLRDIKDEYVKNGIGRIDKFLSKSIEKEKITEADKEKIMSKIKVCCSFIREFLWISKAMDYRQSSDCAGNYKNARKYSIICDSDNME